MTMMISMDAGSCYVRMKCTHATSLHTFKWRLDQHHPVLLRHFVSLALLYKTLDLLTYLLGDNIFTWSIPVLCRSVMVSRHVVCLWKNLYYKNV